MQYVSSYVSCTPRKYVLYSPTASIAEPVFATIIGIVNSTAVILQGHGMACVN